jgi:hypothetical protein
MSVRKHRCPKCGSNNFSYIEHYTAGITFEVENGLIDFKDGGLEVGTVYKITGECFKCSHLWRVRKANQITDFKTN